MDSAEPDSICACGHVYDEHERGRECRVMIAGDGQEEPCSCVHFEFGYDPSGEEADAIGR